MTQPDTVVLSSLGEAKETLYGFVTSGDTFGALGIAQCLWALCEDRETFHRCLREVVASVTRAPGLDEDERDNLAMKIYLLRTDQDDLLLV